MKRVFEAGPECPPIEVLSSLLERGAEDSDRRLAEAHLLHCLHCKTEIGLLREFESGVVRPDEEDAVRWITSRLAQKPAAAAAPASARWWKRGWLPGFAGAVAVILLAAGLSVQWAARQRALPNFGTEVQRSHAIDVIENRSAFQWTPVADASQYELTVRGVDGGVIFHNSFTVLTLAYPPEVARTISTGKVLLWDVVARDAAGNEIARSAIQRIQQRNSGER